MSYLSINFFIFIGILLIPYYAVTRFIKKETCQRLQWIFLLIGSVFFYCINCSLKGSILFFSTIIFSYLFGRLLDHRKVKQKGSVGKFLLFLFIFITCSPLLLIKITPFLRITWSFSLIIPIGLSFYTLQIVAYLTNCYWGSIISEKNLLKYALYVSFFPHIIQGPIPDYSELSRQLTAYHEFDLQELIKGIQLIIWGCFLKMMIADKVSGTVNQVFDNYYNYSGCYIIIAAVLYSIQLYTDFYSCVTICQGVSKLFGIRLTENFQRPYFATSIQEFWKRWHISLSTWLKDYIYIPLGGSRKGKLRTYINLIIVFLVSGFWHGNGYQFIFWGLLHGAYQIVGRLTNPLRKNIYRLFHIPETSFGYRLLKRAGTFLWVAIAWTVFRADGLRCANQIFKNLFVDLKPWAILGTARFSFGLDMHEWIVLLSSLLILLIVSSLQEKGIVLRDRFAEQSRYVRWLIYIIVICVLWIFGTYGYGFNAADFIYGGF